MPGEGPARAELMLVGEAPGAREDEEGRPFCGAAGDYLDNLLEQVGLDRDSIFITSVVKCRPSDNREPHRGEAETCTELHLERQIELIAPRIVVLLGRVAARYVLGETGRLSDVHGELRKQDDRGWLLTYHPAAAMRFPEPGERIREDFRKAARLL